MNTEGDLLWALSWAGLQQDYSSVSCNSDELDLTQDWRLPRALGMKR